MAVRRRWLLALTLVALASVLLAHGHSPSDPQRIDEEAHVHAQGAGLGEPAQNARRSRSSGSTVGVASSETEAPVDTLSLEDLMNTLVMFGNASQVPNHNRFLWDARNLLGTNEEACWEVMAAFRDAEANHRRRALIVDLLVAAGHSTAQSVVRQLIDEADVGEAEWRTLVQRIGLIRAPSSETAQWALQRYHEAEGRNRHAMSLTIGATARGLLRQEKWDEAAPLTASLRSELDTASDDRAILAAIRGLGNAGAPEHAEALRQHASQHDQVRVRCAAMEALRHDPRPENRRFLVEQATRRALTQEEQHAALRTLTSMHPTDANLSQLGQTSFAAEAHADLVRLVDATVGREPARIASARAIIEQLSTSDDPQTRAQAYGWLAMAEVY